MGDWAIGFRFILEREDVQGISMVVANQLSVKMQLLHLIIASILVLKTGHFDFIMERELMLMIALIWETEVNLLEIIAK